MPTKKANLRIRLSRADVNDIAFGQRNWHQITASNDFEVTGDPDLFETYLYLHDHFEFWFIIVTP